MRCEKLACDLQSQQSLAKAIKLGSAVNVLTNWSNLNDLSCGLLPIPIVEHETPETYNQKEKQFMQAYQ
jgi:hypothetical protein